MLIVRIIGDGLSVYTEPGLGLPEGRPVASDEPGRHRPGHHRVVWIALGSSWSPLPLGIGAAVYLEEYAPATG